MTISYTQISKNNCAKNGHIFSFILDDYWFLKIDINFFDFYLFKKNQGCNCSCVQ